MTAIGPGNGMNGNTPARAGTAVDSARARDVAHDLLVRLAPRSDETAGLAPALHDAFTSVSVSLCRSVGADGRNAMLARAWTSVDKMHPTASALRPRGGVMVDHALIASTIKVHGEDVVRAALEAVFTAIVELLIRIVGETMALHLIDYGTDTTLGAAKSEPVG